MNRKGLSSYMTDKLGPLPFCPGCGHNQLTAALDRALVSLQLDPRNVVIVTDIGCVGLSDRYFITNAFHGLHGRSITYACGIKLARPELTVITIQGDGGCGIGGTHLLNVARRNIGITLIIGNNFNYGMTGGQHSVTTPCGGITSTTPEGNLEGPMDLCGTAKAAGAAWVYRATAFDEDLPEVMARAIRQPGFSMLDVLELCTAYFAPRNRFKKKDLFDHLEKHHLDLGLLVDEPRPEYTERYRELRTNARPLETEYIDVKHKNFIHDQTGIVIAGSAGQKIQSTATLFARAAIACGLEATQKNDYPITVKTGHSVAELILSPDRIDYTATDSPAYVLLLSGDGLKKMGKKIRKLPGTCTIFADSDLDLPSTNASVLKLDLSGTGGSRRLPISFVALAALLERTGIFPMEAFSESISRFQRSDLRQISLDALEAGKSLVLP